MSLFSTIKFITTHPMNKYNKTAAVLRFIKWQLNSVMNPYPIIYQFTEKSKLIIKKGMTGASGNLYCGLFDYQEMFFLLHFLRRGDFFADIGANIGSYTILASAQIEANTISIEPMPSTYLNLLDNISVNRLQNVKPLNIALGSKKGKIDFTKTAFDTTNHIAVKGDKDVITVDINTLDDILATGEDIPLLLKIDVEGYETEVLNGALETLKNENLKAIIIELNGSGERYGYDEALIHKELTDKGFLPYTYNPLERALTLVESFGSYNTIYIRNLEFVNERLKFGEKIQIRKNKI
ncbi:FkbM family methyltransferase [Pedobacter sp. ASV28]|uniref:FkbM family methyltransferase n=1 Tax=Pedobacter sp. ASV28 TaxID=2795123 RepID=UPI0018EA499B|nr:FkbM family methyltransferase [Pedobacter sp. ASV28]